MTLDDIAGRVSACPHAHDGTASVPPTTPTGRRRRQPPRPAALVAGGAGFLGSHLCDRLLAEGMRVYCLDSFQTGRPENVAHLLGEPGFVMVEHDVRAPAPVFPDLVEVYNLACPASPPHYQKAPVSTAMTSVQGTLELLTLATRVGARFLLTSTSEIYGDPEVHPQPETYCGRVNPIGPRACYDEGKRLAETLCFDFMRQHGVDVRVARIFNTYGPRMRLDDGRVVSNLIGQALRGAAMTIYGDGSQTRSFCYAGDTVDGLMRLMRREGRLDTPVNIGSQDEIPVIEIARRVAALTGRDTGIVHLPLPVDDPQRRRPELGLADSLLDWRPTTPLDAGLRRTIAYFRGELRRTDGAPASAIASSPPVAAVPAHASTLEGEPGRV